jgi:hypothetical protein
MQYCIVLTATLQGNPWYCDLCWHDAATAQSHHGGTLVEGVGLYAYVRYEIKSDHGAPAYWL